jgi:hypothetical protein
LNLALYFAISTGFNIAFLLIGDSTMVLGSGSIVCITSVFTVSLFLPALLGILVSLFVVNDVSRVSIGFLFLRKVTFPRR